MDHAAKVRLVESYVAAYNAQDFDTILAFFAEDATMEDPVGAPPATGLEAIRALYAAGFAMGIRLELDGRIRTAASSVAFPLVATSASGKLHIIDVFDFDGSERVAQMRAYWSPENLEGEMDLQV